MPKLLNVFPSYPRIELVKVRCLRAEGRASIYVGACFKIKIKCKNPLPQAHTPPHLLASRANRIAFCGFMRLLVGGSS